MALIRGNEPVGAIFAPYGSEMKETTVSSRWLAFNGVGALGVAVQLGVLALLTRVAELPVVLATVMAVEAAIVHNFLWHQRWTWSNRGATDSRAVWRRLVRFHA